MRTHYYGVHAKYEAPWSFDRTLERRLRRESTEGGCRNQQHYIGWTYYQRPAAMRAITKLRRFQRITQLSLVTWSEESRGQVDFGEKPVCEVVFRGAAQYAPHHNNWIYA